MAVALGALGAIALWRGRPIAPVLLGAAAVFAAAGLVVPRLLAPVERAWMWFAEVLAAVMTRVILTLTFILVITPVGLVRRLLGFDSLGLRPDRTSTTYWTAVETDGPCSRPDTPY